MAERTITISEENAATIDRLVAEGRVSSIDAVVNAGIMTVEDERGADGDPVFERWLREEVVPALGEMRAHPERGIPIEEVRRSLRERHEARMAEAESGLRTGRRRAPSSSPGKPAMISKAYMSGLRMRAAP